MVDEGPWEPVEQSESDESDGETEAEGWEFWDYALVGVVAVLVILAGVVLVTSQNASTRWSLDARGELGESEETLIVTEDAVIFDAAVGFAGSANGDVVENVRLRAIGVDGSTLGTTCLGTLTNDADHRLQTVQIRLNEGPARVVIEATAVRSDSEYFVRGWSNDGGTMGGDSLFVENRSTYINDSACQ